MTRRLAATIGSVLLLIAVLLAVVGVVYLTKGAKDLPSFFPGAAHHGKHKETNKAIAAFVAAAVLAVIAVGGVALSGRRPAS